MIGNPAQHNFQSWETGPHTWDGPLLYLVGGTSQVAVLKLCTWLPPV